MYGYTKLFETIVGSSLWGEPYATRIVWITMLAVKDREHLVRLSVPGLARIANVTLEECVAALKALSSPDPDSRTKEEDGRRIREVDGGWFVVNGEKYRQMFSLEERREYLRRKQAEYRSRSARADKQAEAREMGHHARQAGAKGWIDREEAGEE